MKKCFNNTKLLFFTQFWLIRLNNIGQLADICNAKVPPRRRRRRLQIWQLKKNGSFPLLTGLWWYTLKIKRLLLFLTCSKAARRPALAARQEVFTRAGVHCFTIMISQLRAKIPFHRRGKGTRHFHMTRAQAAAAVRTWTIRQKNGGGGGRPRLNTNKQTKAK